MLMGRVRHQIGQIRLRTDRNLDLFYLSDAVNYNRRYGGYQ